MNAPAGLLRLTEGLKGRSLTFFFCDKDGIWFFHRNSQQKLVFMLSKLKGMVSMLVLPFIKLSFLVIRGTDIIDLNASQI